MTKPRVGVSACLLGQPVRYNGGAKPDAWLIEVLSQAVDFVPFCPEMEMGLGTPREALRLVRERTGDPLALRETNSGKDHTEIALSTRAKIYGRLRDVDGVILKKASPTCGLERVKVYGKDGIPGTNAPGIFGGGLLETFPDLPVTEEGRLTDLQQREHFVTRVFGHFRLRALIARVSEIQKFHQSHKFLLMAHSPFHYNSLGRLAANSEGLTPVELLLNYRRGFLDALKESATASKKVNVVQHVMGYFKRDLTQPEKQHLLGILEDYRLGRIPYAAVISVLEHLMSRFSQPYLKDQVFFYPFPRELSFVHKGA